MLKRKRILLILLMPISLLISLIVNNNEWIAEYVFARGVYKYLSQFLSIITGLVPISLMEMSIYLLIILALISLFYIIIKRFNKTEENNNQKEKSANILINVGCVFSVLIFLFTIFAGTNYHRYPFSKLSHMEVEDSSIEELYLLNVYLANQAYNFREELELEKELINESGLVRTDSMGWRELTNIGKDAYDNISEHYPFLAGKYGRPKQILNSKLMSRMEITGIFFPFTLEANINTHAPDYTSPVTITHEMAHQRGFMREDEANYIGFLACMYSENLLYQYSGTMLALTHAGNALYREAPELYHKSRGLFHEGMKADLRESSDYWSQFNDTVISTVSTKMNDTYLKANKQEEGVKSYGRMVDLLLAGFKRGDF